MEQTVYDKNWKRARNKANYAQNLFFILTDEPVSKKDTSRSPKGL